MPAKGAYYPKDGRTKPRTPKQLAHIESLKALNAAKKGKPQLTKSVKNTDNLALTPLVAKSERVKLRLAKDIEGSTKDLRKVRRSRTLESIKERAEVQNLLATVSSKVFDWESTSSNSSNPININLLTVPTPQPTQSEAIDVVEVTPNGHKLNPVPTRSKSLKSKG